jgi:hypothetical protein
MSFYSNHTPEAIATCGFDADETDPGRPVEPEPTEAEINAMGAAAGQLLNAPAWAGEILNILPESAPTADRKIAAPTSARPPRQPRQKTARSVRLLSRTHGMYELPDVATVEITMSTSGQRIGSRTDTFRYVVEPIPADFGRGFQVTREDTSETYAVNLNGRQSTCECKGHLQHGHCKHTAGLQALVNLSLL